MQGLYQLLPRCAERPQVEMLIQHIETSVVANVERQEQGGWMINTRPLSSMRPTNRDSMTSDSPADRRRRTRRRGRSDTRPATTPDPRTKLLSRTFIRACSL